MINLNRLYVALELIASSKTTQTGLENSVRMITNGDKFKRALANYSHGESSTEIVRSESTCRLAW